MQKIMIQVKSSISEGCKNLSLEEEPLHWRLIALFIEEFWPTFSLDIFYYQIITLQFSWLNPGLKRFLWTAAAFQIEKDRRVLWLLHYKVISNHSSSVTKVPMTKISWAVSPKGETIFLLCFSCHSSHLSLSIYRSLNSTSCLTHFEENYFISYVICFKWVFTFLRRWLLLLWLLLLLLLWLW